MGNDELVTLIESQLEGNSEVPLVRIPYHNVVQLLVYIRELEELNKALVVTLNEKEMQHGFEPGTFA